VFLEGTSVEAKVIFQVLVRYLENLYYKVRCEIILENFAKSSIIEFRRE
jgi:hypothetical protein